MYVCNLLCMHMHAAVHVHMQRYLSMQYLEYNDMICVIMYNTDHMHGAGLIIIYIKSVPSLSDNYLLYNTCIISNYNLALNFFSCMQLVPYIAYEHQIRRLLYVVR